MSGVLPGHMDGVAEAGCQSSDFVQIFGQISYEMSVCSDLHGWVCIYIRALKVENWGSHKTNINMYYI